MRLAILGTGYVGLVTGTCMADSGYDVVCIDKDKGKIAVRGACVSPPIWRRGCVGQALFLFVLVLPNRIQGRQT